MKKTVFVVLLFIAGSLYAQDVGLWMNIRHSSYTIDNNLHIRCEVIDIPDSYTNFYYSQGNGWYNQELVPVVGETYEAVIPVDPSETVYCRYRTVMAQGFDGFDDILPDLPDSLVVMMPGYLPADNFPPAINEMAFVAEDNVGDIPPGIQNHLDITAQYFSYSATRFYAAMTNNSDGYPTGPILGPYNVYASLVLNPETAITDTVFYALVYAQVPVLITPGLYRFSGLSIDGLQRIGNIEYHIDGNNLIKACSIDVLTSDPYFGDWPNMTNSLLTIPLTMQISLSMDIVLADIGLPAMMVFDEYFIEPFENNLPELSDIDVLQFESVTTVSLSYFDPDGNFPLIAELILDNEETYQFLPLGFNYHSPVQFTTTFYDEWTEGLIRFSDNGYEFTEHQIFGSSVQESLPLVDRLNLTVYPNPYSSNAEGNRLRIELDYQSRVVLKGASGNSEPDAGEAVLFSRQNVEYELQVFDIKGRLVYNMIQQPDEAGKRLFFWDGRDNRGKQVASGLYLIKVTDTIEQRGAFGRVLIVK